MRFLKIYRYFSFFNLDIVFGALAFAWLGAQVSNIELPSYHYSLLVMAVWSIYTLDRLMDNYLPNTPETTRHVFWKRHARWGWAGIVLVCIAALAILFYFKPLHLLKGGLMLAVCVGIYLLSKQYQSKTKQICWWKEIVIALSYVLGITIAWWSVSNTWSIEMYVFCLYLFLLTFLNLMVIGRLEKEEDLTLSEKSLVDLLSEKSFNILITIIVAFSAIVVPFLSLPYSWDILLAVLPWLMLFPLFLTKLFLYENLYRYWADGLLILPLIFLHL